MDMYSDFIHFRLHRCARCLSVCPSVTRLNSASLWLLVDLSSTNYVANCTYSTKNVRIQLRIRLGYYITDQINQKTGRSFNGFAIRITES